MIDSRLSFHFDLKPFYTRPVYELFFKLNALYDKKYLNIIYCCLFIAGKRI